MNSFLYKITNNFSIQFHENIEGKFSDAIPWMAEISHSTRS